MRVKRVGELPGESAPTWGGRLSVTPAPNERPLPQNTQNARNTVPSAPGGAFWVFWVFCRGGVTLNTESDPGRGVGLPRGCQLDPLWTTE